MAEFNDKRVNDIENRIKEILEIIIVNNKIVIDVISNCSTQSIKDAKKILNINDMTKIVKEMDSMILEVLKSKDVKNCDMKRSVKYLKINSEIEKIAKNTRSVLSKLENCCKDLDNKEIRKASLNIYEYIIKILESVIEMIDYVDEDDINDAYDEIVILEAKIDHIYENTNKYIMKKFDKKNSYKDIMLMLRKSEKIAYRVASISSLIKFNK